MTGNNPLSLSILEEAPLSQDKSTSTLSCSESRRKGGIPYLCIGKLLNLLSGIAGESIRRQQGFEPGFFPNDEQLVTGAMTKNQSSYKEIDRQSKYREIEGLSMERTGDKG
jgi:hypothetical protein